MSRSGVPGILFATLGRLFVRPQVRRRIVAIGVAGMQFFLLVLPVAPRKPSQGAQQKLQKPRQLDSDVTYKRNPSTGELTSSAPGLGSPNSVTPPNAICVTARIVPITCSVFAADGVPVRGIARENFQVFDDNQPEQVTYFDESTRPASVALVVDASPSVLRDSAEMKQAASALIEGLAPADEVAIVDFSAHTYVQSDFTSVRELLRRAVARVNVNQLLGDTGGSNIYQAVYLTASGLFAGRAGRKAIILLTDGQDSGMGLTLDPASTAPKSSTDNRLTFDDLSRKLAAEDIQIYAVSTENRPKIMTSAWLAAHRDQSLLTQAARRLGIPAYTLFLAEIARRSGGELYFLHEAETLADTFRQIAKRVNVEYTLGISPSQESPAAWRPGWHELKVDVIGQGEVSVVHRAAYYVPASP
jgi:Ca-activated chloride channel family protein